MAIRYSVLVPCYNEQKRGRDFLVTLRDYLGKIPSLELILINDGSRDGTLALLKGLAKGYRFVRVLDLRPNRGKGGALQAAVKVAKGKYIMFIDADGSIGVKEIPHMLRLLERHPFVIATRNRALEKVRQPFYRLFVGVTFNTYVNMLYGLGIRDTLCGFKGFTRETAHKLFTPLISKRWIFDVEIMYRARKLGIPITQFSIYWEHRGESKMKFLDPVRMAWELLDLRMKI